MLLLLFGCGDMGYEADQRLAHRIATQVQGECQRLGICPRKEALPDWARPREFEFRLLDTRRGFAVLYRGTPDRGCHYALLGGVGARLRQQRVCDEEVWRDIRRRYLSDIR